MLALLLLSILTLAFGARPVEADGMVLPFSSLLYAPLAHAQTALADTINNCRVDSSADPVTIHFAATMGTTSLQQYDSVIFSNAYDCFYAKTLADIDGYTSSSLDSQVKSALASMPMIGNMPRTYQSYWLVYDRYMINAYRWSQQWNIETAKWNETQAAEEAINCYHKAGRALLGLDLDRGYLASNRYYDENGQTLDIMNKLGSSSDALAIWNYLNSAHWNGQIYTYTPGGGFECEVGPFAMLIGYYHATNPTIPYFDRISLDLYNKMLKNGWSSPAWSSSPGVMQHASSNSEKRLENTLDGFTALQAYYCLGSTDYKQAFQSLLTDSPKAWEALVSSPLYSSGKFSWREGQSVSDAATASGMMLLLLEGVVPDTGCLAIPLNEWRYQDQATMLPYTHFRFDYSSRRIRIPVFAGSIKFQFGTSVANATFTSNGIFEVQFSSDWNNVIGVNLVSPLSDQFYYLQPAETPPPPPSKPALYIRADGSIDPLESPISTVDNVTYTLTGNISDSIGIERSNIIVDGSGYVVQGSGDGCGFNLTGIANVTIKNTNIRNFCFAIGLSSSNSSTINGNNITANNQSGIRLDGSSSNNTISGNTITANNHFGIDLFESPGDNKIYHNDFANNMNHVSSLLTLNIWDDGYPSGGNYWSDYNDTDLFSGPHQNETGSDSIGDTPYIIDANNQDNFPLMNPYGSANIIGVVNVTTSKTIVGQSFCMWINVGIVNYGANTVIFNATVYANATTIETKDLTLTGGNSTSIAFIWNTTGFAKGNYTISVFVEAVSGEVNIADNNCTDGVVYVGIPGDINGDGIVEMMDFLVASHAFAAWSNHTRWNHNADIDNNDIVEMMDFYIMAQHYLEH
jgi:parallel beta-helix repeat protein